MAMTKIEIALNLLNKATSEQLPKIIEQIDSALTGISQENFSQYGKQLVVYGNILFAKANDEKDKNLKKKYEEILNRFYQRLRTIGKLGIDRDLAFFINMWNQIMSQIRAGYANSIGDNTKIGSFAYFYFLVQVNNLLSDSKFSCNTLIGWLILRDRINWIEERNLNRVILIAIRSLVKEEDVQSLINYFYKANRNDVLQMIMREALQIGRCKTVKSLLDKQIILPPKIEDVWLTFQLAISNNMAELSQIILENFDIPQILDYCLRNGWYKLAVNYFKILSPMNIPKSLLVLITEIAATYGDLEALTLFISICSESDRKELYHQHILPCFIPTAYIDQPKNAEEFYTQQHLNATSIIYYYMKQDNKFSFTAESSAPGCMTLVDCGHLRKYIAYQMSDPQADLFGTIRHWDITTKVRDNIKQYSEPTQSLIEKHGQAAKDKLLLELLNESETQVKELPITAQFPTGNVMLAMLRKYTHMVGVKDFDIVWHHASWNDIANILNNTQKIWLDFSQARKNEHNHQLRISGLRNFARIHHYFGPTCVYARGSAAIGEMIISAAALTIELDDLRKHQKMKPDCIATITSTCDEYIEKYPELYGFKNYDEMATQLHNEFLKRMSRKESELHVLENRLNEASAAKNPAMAQVSPTHSINQTPEVVNASLIDTKREAIAQTKLEKALSLLQKRSAENIDNIIVAINSALEELTEKIFDQHGNALVIYGDILYSKTFNDKGEIVNKEFHARLEKFYMHLRRIGKLGSNRDLKILNVLWKKILAILNTGIELQDNTKNNSFVYFFQLNRVNNRIYDDTLCCFNILESLIPSRISWIEERNLNKAIRICVESLSDIKVNAFMEFCHNNKRLDLLMIFMRYALEQGRCKIVEWLLKKNISLPTTIDRLGLVLQIAYECDYITIINAINAKFSCHEILAYFINRKLYSLALLILRKYPETRINFKELTGLCEIAAACGDVKALKFFLSKCPAQEREDLFNQSIVTYYIPAAVYSNKYSQQISLRSVTVTDAEQDKYNQHFKQSISVISYYMKKKHFIFSLASSESNNFTLVNCGHLRKVIAYKLNGAEPYSFGTIRSAGIATPLLNDSNEYSQRTLKMITQCGFVNKEDPINSLDPSMSLRQYKVYAQLSPTQKVVLTTYSKASGNFANHQSLHKTTWLHADWNDFPVILNHSQKIWLAFCELCESNHDQAVRINALRKLAAIHYYLSPTCVYYRGSSAVTEKIISGAAFNIELDDLRKHQQKRPDIEGILSQSCNEYVENYPEMHGFKNYDEMVTVLHQEFMARMARKDAKLNDLRLFIKNNCERNKSSTANISNKLSAETDIDSIEFTQTKASTKSNLELSDLKFIGDMQNSILFFNNKNLNQGNLSRPFYGNSIEDLIRELCEKGPLKMLGKYGQAFYTVNSGIVTHDFANQKINANGWALNTFKDNFAIDPQQIIVVGARKDGDKRYVYYVCSPVSSTNQNQIFVISHARFMESRKLIQCSDEQKSLAGNANYVCRK